MPFLSSRRSRSMSTSRPAPPGPSTASSPAHLAAAQAFLASQPSNSALSASAAATALRTMSPPPTPVNQVQTKRMLNRQTSNSSVASAPRGRSRGIVQRRTSSGSMTERTFRSPSPAQQPSLPPVSGPGVPPVPAVPSTYSEDIPQIPQKSHRRSASMDTFPTRVGSPPLTTRGRSQVTTQNLAINSAANAMGKRNTNPPAAPEMQRSDSQDSRNSINFSYPRGSRPSSPPPRSPLATSNKGPVSSATNGISAAEASKIQHDLTQVAATPVKKKKKVMDQSVAEGRHLQSGTMGIRPKVTPLEPLPADYQPPAAEPVKKPKKKAMLSGQSSHFPHQGGGSFGDASDSDTASESPQDRRALRASGALMKQPSVVREDWEGEQEEQESSPVEKMTTKPVRAPVSTVATPVQSKKTTPEANTARKIEDHSTAPKTISGVHSAVTTNPIKVETSKSLLTSPQDTSAGRSISISPSRSTRFSDRLSSDLAAGRKHEPLGRSISPAKSALKHSSAASDASPTDPRFPGRRGSSVTPSEASDASADGTSSRKKSVRVSFDAPSDSKDSFTDARSSRDSSKKTRVGPGRGKTTALDPVEVDEEVQEGMKPRPALPSFGSVRRNERSTSPNVRAEPKSGSSSETSSIADPPTMNTSISSEYALGGLTLKDSQRATASSLNRKDQVPLPPAVTSKESIGYESDTSSIYSEADKPLHAAQSASHQLGKAIGSEAHAEAYRDEIPMIAVLPATPGIDELHAGGVGDEVPGGFPTSGSQPNQANTATPSSPQQLTTITEEDSDAESVYSDAAEDLSDLEGDGFGSINAIVESPMVTTPAQRITSPPESPLVALDKKRPVETERTTSWDDTQAHWSGLAQRTRDTKQSPPQTAVEPAETPRATTTAPPVSKMTKAPITPKAQTAQPVQQASTRIAIQPQPTAVVAAKQMTPLKSQTPLKSSMKRDPETLTAATKPRPASYTGPSSPPRAALQKKHIPPAQALAPAPKPKGPPRRFSNDSDSDSSFRKARRNKKQADGGFTMRRSMRSGPSESERPSAPIGRSGVRSLSPPPNRRPTSPMGMKTMRSTMRGSQESNVPTLRGQPEGKRSSSLFSRNRTAKSPTRSVTGFSGKLKSRLADSDDEGDARPEHYKSRFADSSDEDEPKSFRPVRGIPRKKDEGDSTDLDDSSDDQARARKSKPAAAKKLSIVPPSPSQEVASPPLSPTTAKKRGLWSRIRGKKKEEEGEEDIPSNAGQTIAQREGIKDEIEAGKEESQDAKKLGFNSAAERDALVEQTRLKLEAAKERTQSPVDQPGSPLGKLQRRMTPQRILSDSWAPPKMPAADADDRPQTSGAVDGTNRPAMGSRQPTNEVVNGDGAVYGKTGKKKKFGFLRKAFGLTD